MADGTAARQAPAGGAYAPPAAIACGRCGSQVAPSLLACPSCQALVHAAELKRLAALGEGAEGAGRTTEALQHWNDVLALLPPESAQHAAVRERVARLAAGDRASPGAGGAAARSSPFGRAWLAAAGVGLFLLGKGKLLLLGLTKLKTLGSMLAFLGVYWSLWGWKFALGFVVAIYVHEMGHVAALARYGIRADAPMFIPGLGAYVRMRQLPATAAQDARVGLAGPIWGLAAGLAAYGVFLATGAPIWSAIARSAGWLNLFNLLPVWQLDGGRGFRALSRPQRWGAALALGVAWAATQQGLLLLLLLVAAWQAFRDAPDESDHAVLATYAGLVAVLAWLSMVAVPGVG